MSSRDMKKSNMDLLLVELKRHRELEKKYKDLAFEIAKPVIEDINRTFGVSYDIKILVGYENAKKELKNFPYNSEAATPVLKDNTVYIIVGDEYYLSALNTLKEIKGEPIDIPLPLTVVHEYLHVVLGKVLPKTQEEKLGLDRILGIDVPMWEFWTELFTNLFWRRTYDKEIPEHRYSIADLPMFYLNDIKEILEKQKEISRLKEKLKGLEEAKKIIDKEGCKYLAERGGKFYCIGIPEGSEVYNSRDILRIKINSLEFGEKLERGRYKERIRKLEEALELFDERYKTIVVTPEGKIIGYKERILPKEEIELSYTLTKRDIENLRQEHPLWWINFDTAYLFADTIAEEFWKKYGRNSVNVLIEKIRKYGTDLERVIDKEVLEISKNKNVFMVLRKFG